MSYARAYVVCIVCLCACVCVCVCVYVCMYICMMCMKVYLRVLRLNLLGVDLGFTGDNPTPPLHFVVLDIKYKSHLSKV